MGDPYLSTTDSCIDFLFTGDQILLETHCGHLQLHKDSPWIHGKNRVGFLLPSINRFRMRSLRAAQPNSWSRQLSICQNFLCYVNQLTFKEHQISIANLSVTVTISEWCYCSPFFCQKLFFSLDFLLMLINDNIGKPRSRLNSHILYQSLQRMLRNAGTDTKLRDVDAKHWLL